MAARVFARQAAIKAQLEAPEGENAKLRRRRSPQAVPIKGRLSPHVMFVRPRALKLGPRKSTRGGFYMSNRTPCASGSFLP